MQEEVKEIYDQITLVQNKKVQTNNEMVRFQSTLTAQPSVSQQKQLENFEAQLLAAELERSDLQEKLTKLQVSVREIAKIFQQGFILDLFWLLPVPTRSQPILAPPSEKGGEGEEFEKYKVPSSRFALIATPETVKAVPLAAGEPVPASIQAPDILVDREFLQESDRFKKMSDKEKQQESVLAIQKDLSVNRQPSEPSRQAMEKEKRTVSPEIVREKEMASKREKETQSKGSKLTREIEAEREVLKGYVPQTKAPLTKEKP
jgi:hypothetical protein